jgi:deoxyribonuclease-1-like protein
MGKQLLFGLVLIALAVAVYFSLNYQWESHYENGKLGYVKIAPKRGSDAGGDPSSPLPSADSLRPTFRIATFHLGRFDDAKAANRRVSDVLMHLLPQFELIAVQGVRGKNQGVLVRLVEQISAASGRAFDFATCPTQKREALEHYSAFIFDRARIEVDRTTVRFVEDPLGRFRVKPLVGQFRARGPDPLQAFTFMLINVETDPERAAAELDLLAEVYRTVRDRRGKGGAGKMEDDIILLGDLESDDAHLGQLGRLLGVAPLLSGVPSTVRGTQLLDNILLDRRATCEFTGRVEVVDMLRDFELTAPDAAEVSEHLPVWAEFSIYEGGQPGHVLPPAAK